MTLSKNQKIAVGVGVALLLIAGGSWYYYKKMKPKEEPTNVEVPESDTTSTNIAKSSAPATTSTFKY